MWSSRDSTRRDERQFGWHSPTTPAECCVSLRSSRNVLEFHPLLLCGAGYSFTEVWRMYESIIERKIYWVQARWTVTSSPRTASSEATTPRIDVLESDTRWLKRSTLQLRPIQVLTLGGVMLHGTVHGVSNRVGLHKLAPILVHDVVHLIPPLVQSFSGHLSLLGQCLEPVRPEGEQIESTGVARKPNTACRRKSGLLVVTLAHQLRLGCEGL